MACLFSRRVWLVLHRINYEHFSGVFLFCLGSFMYCMALLRLGEQTHAHLAPLHAILEYALFFSSMALVTTFVVLWVMEENAGKHGRDPSDPTQKAFILEHAAYLTQLLFYAAFFLFHSPDPCRDTVEKIYDEENNSAGIELGTMSPLIPVAITPL